MREVAEKRKHGVAVSVFAGFFLVSLLAGCGAAGEKHRPSGQEKVSYASMEGARLFRHYCAICHGENGDGSGRYYGGGLAAVPADFTQEAFFSERDDDHLFKAISDGSASVGKTNLCPPWGLTLHEEEVGFLVGHIRSFAEKEQQPENGEMAQPTEDNGDEVNQ